MSLLLILSKIACFLFYWPLQQFALVCSHYNACCRFLILCSSTCWFLTVVRIWIAASKLWCNVWWRIMPCPILILMEVRQIGVQEEPIMSSCDRYVISTLCFVSIYQMLSLFYYCLFNTWLLWIYNGTNWLPSVLTCHNRLINQPSILNLITADFL